MVTRTPVNHLKSLIFTEWRDPFSRARISALLKMLLSLISYGVVLEAVTRCEATLGHSRAIAVMSIFTAAMLFLALAYLAIFRRIRWLPLAGSSAYFAVCATTFCLEAANPFAARTTLLVGTFVMLFTVLVTVFTPFKKMRP